MVKIKLKKKIVSKKESEKVYKQHQGMNLLENSKGLLLAEGCKLDKRKKAAEKRLKEIKKELDLTQKGDYTNRSGNIVKVTVVPKKSDIDPKRLHSLLVKKKMISRFWSCIKVQLTPLKKVIPESAIEKMQEDLDDIIKCSFK